MALERQRISQRGITGYQWCGSDDGALLFPLSGDLYLVRLTADGPRAQRPTPAPALEPRCAPDGQRLAYVQGGNLFVLPLAVARPPADDGRQRHAGWGLAEFIAAEELARQRGYWWSRTAARCWRCAWTNPASRSRPARRSLPTARP
jgi:dipeptidyl-peptidase-4